MGNFYLCCFNVATGVNEGVRTAKGSVQRILAMRIISVVHGLHLTWWRRRPASLHVQRGPIGRGQHIRYQSHGERLFIQGRGVQDGFRVRFHVSFRVRNCKLVVVRPQSIPISYHRAVFAVGRGDKRDAVLSCGGEGQVVLLVAVLVRLRLSYFTNSARIRDLSLVDGSAGRFKFQHVGVVFSATKGRCRRWGCQGGVECGLRARTFLVVSANSLPA